MKITAVLLLVAALQVSAKGWTQEKISLSYNDAPLEQVFNSITAQAGIAFFYRPQYVKGKKVTINVTNASLRMVLDMCLKNQQLTYEIVGKTVAIHPFKKDHIEATADGKSRDNESGPTIDVTGRVINEKGDPVPDVTVTVKGTQISTVTNSNGEFALSTIERDATLVFSHVSMESFEYKVSGNKELLISLKTKISALGEVMITVNTGYQQVKRERFVGSVAIIDSAAFHRRVGMNILDRLDGTITGILFDKKQKNGDLLTNVQIRGLSTLNASKVPLLIVDDFPFTQDISTINPNEVESITVLKDAAAASIWGARAGNGVIVITTKKGKFNQPLRVTVNSNLTIDQKPDLYYYPQMSVSDFVDAEEFLFQKGFYDADLANTNSWPVISPVVEMLAKRRAGKVSAADSVIQINAFKEADLRRDLDKYVYRHAVLQQHFISLNGGNNLIAYNLSVGYNKRLDNIQKSRPNEQYTMYSSIKLHPVKNLEISNQIRYAQSVDKNSAFILPPKVYPYMQLADAEGNPLPVPDRWRLSYIDTVGSGQLLDWRYRPLEELNSINRNTISRAILLNFDATYRFLRSLSASLTYQYSNQSSAGNNYQSLQSYNTRSLINQYTNLAQMNATLRNPIPIGGILDESHSTITSHNARGRVDFNKTFDGLHQVSAMFAADISEATSGLSANRFYNYNKNMASYQTEVDYTTVFPNIYTGGSNKIPNGSLLSPSRTNRFVSFTGNVSYLYKGLYNVYASARKDGSNIFGVNANNKWKPLWSMGASWNISNEDFYAIKWMPVLRVKASYGYSGNPGPVNVTGLPIIEYSAVPGFLTNLPFATPVGAPNPNLRWEKVRTINAGIDLSLFNNRISTSIDIWQKRSTDLVTNIPYAPASGVILFTTNSANLKGTGFELNLVSKNIDRIFKWETNVGLSYAKTVVEKIIAANPRYKASDFINYSLNVREGMIVYGLSSFRWGGLDPLTGDPCGNYNKQVSTNYTNILNDSAANQIFHGSAIPLYSGFIGNSFSWKRFTLSANITYRFKFYFRKPTISYSDLANSWIGNADYANRWKTPGDENQTTVPSFTYPINSERDFFYQYSEVNVLRGDNIRLQDIRLQYSYSSKKKMFFKSAQVFVYANNLNLILWRKNSSDLDPDFVGASNILLAPIPKSLTTGISVSF